MEATPVKLKIEFGTPQYNWLPVVMSAGDFVLDFKASGVLDDPLTELTSCLVLVVQELKATMSWWLEPQEYHFQFSILPQHQIKLSISKISESGAGRRVFDISASSEAIILPFWRALRRLNPDDFTEDNWYPLPLEKLDKLTQLVRAYIPH